MSLARKSGGENPDNTNVLTHMAGRGFFEDGPASKPRQAARGSSCPQIAYPALQDRLIVLFNLKKRDAHSLCSNRGHTAGDRDLRARMHDGDLDLCSRVQGSWSGHKTSTHAQITGAG